MEHRIPNKEQVESYLHERRNWGRWGEQGGAGAVNLITPEKCLKAISLVKKGHTVSLSRPFPVTPSIENPHPAQHFVMLNERLPGGGAVTDYYGVRYHGTATTHIDALCHVWDQYGMWDGRRPSDVITSSGASYGSVDEWSAGLITRGILLDVPKHRGTQYVTMDEPVHGWELEEITRKEGIVLEPGDAVLVYSGREAYACEHGGFWGGSNARPGLHASCLPFIRDNDIAVLGWDMMDASPNEYGIPWTVHGAIFAYGVALLDNSLLQPLAEVCAVEGRYEFMLAVSPLRVIGGTGSPVNPIAVF